LSGERRPNMNGVGALASLGTSAQGQFRDRQDQYIGCDGSHVDVWYRLSEHIGEWHIGHVILSVFVYAFAFV